MLEQVTVNPFRDKTKIPLSWLPLFHSDFIMALVQHTISVLMVFNAGSPFERRFTVNNCRDSRTVDTIQSIFGDNMSTTMKSSNDDVRCDMV
jgi:hypothetical protein